ncbi:Transcription initiation protein spt3 [Fusarium torreyae]|uniref:Transcription initiation protein spt3 n=1 Tax=Fusarium torreyae TaxID=1237075 RepID=A0A9W8RVY7_9HYPO|nr:Transcription initiation protein spt3 [Fusarium torreyae]
MAKFEAKYNAEIQQMMYVAGETGDVSTETLTLVEEIIRDQLVLMLTTANDLAARRGQRVFGINDIIFQVRHDPARLARLQTLLRWKAIRRKAKANNENNEDDLEADDGEDLAEEDLVNATVEDAATKKTERPAALLPWDVEFFFSEYPPGGDDNESLLAESSATSLERLRWADEVTKNMTAAEYSKWSDYRHASFISRKKKRFRTWCGLGVIAQNKSTDDSLEIIGFLAVEMVKRLTDIALSIQEQELSSKQRLTGQSAALVGARSYGLFVSANPERPPVDVGHVRRAFEMTQMKAKRRRVQLNRIPNRRKLELI